MYYYYMIYMDINLSKIILFGLILNQQIDPVLYG